MRVGEHGAGRGLAAKEGALGIDTLHPIPVRLVQFHHRHAVAASSGCGIVNQDVDPAKGCDDLVDHRLHLGGVTNISNDAERAPTQGFDFTNNLGHASPAASRRRCRVDVVERHVRPFLREAQRDGAADATLATGTGD